MTNELSDRHVLAAAVGSDAEALVTSNIRHFPAAVCEPFDIEVVHPDAFLCELHGRAPAKIHVALTRQQGRSLDHGSPRRNSSIV